MLTTYFGSAPLILDAPDIESQSKLPKTARNVIIEQILKESGRSSAGVAAAVFGYR